MEKRFEVVSLGSIKRFTGVRVCHMEKAAVNEEEEVFWHALSNQDKVVEV